MAEKATNRRPAAAPGRPAERPDSRKRQPADNSGPSLLRESIKPETGHESARAGPADPPDRP
jgi:hypothetical protein